MMLQIKIFYKETLSIKGHWGIHWCGDSQELCVLYSMMLVIVNMVCLCENVCFSLHFNKFVLLTLLIMICCVPDCNTCYLCFGHVYFLFALIRTVTPSPLGEDEESVARS